ncbi:MAG: DNA polymerase III subunit gamma/tau, partial [Isosphaeraceae bacterium]
TVVARRYRPQRFEDVVGQDHVVQALRNAIRLNRLAQAYLFCGTRGVGKTSMARIFAKCLNCVQGPTETPCQVCDICQSIAAGQDVDVIEIDGASNNGVEQVRELRQNASLRPSRSRFKIYYIDEVHMLSTGAFNALLKTLEEPPPHVKFFFATTEANKIPITVLSRCQRYDFAGITPDAIVSSLKEICAREQVETETEALQVVARRAGGSMRDAQSLLEQLLASGSPKLTVEVVHQLLGTPSDERLLGVLEALAGHDAGTALSLLDQAAAQGVQPADLLAGVVDFLRDALMLSVGAGSILLAVTPRQKPRLQTIIKAWPTDTILAALQILAEARARMRGATHGRLLVELALVRVARLENLTELSNLVDRLAAIESGSPTPRKTVAQSVKQKLSPANSSTIHEADPREQVQRASRGAEKTDPEPSPVDLAPLSPVTGRSPVEVPASGPTDTGASQEPAAGAADLADASAQPCGASATAADQGQGTSPEAGRGGERPPLELEAVRRVWPDLVTKVGKLLGMKLVATEPIRVEGPDVLVIAAKPGYNTSADACGSADARRKIEHSLERLLYRPVVVRYERSTAPEPTPQQPSRTDPRRGDMLARDPMVQRIVELFEARAIHLEYEDDSDLV